MTLMLVGLILSGCAGNNDSEAQNKDGAEGSQPTALSAEIKVAALAGPTGIGMAYLMDQQGKYQVDVYQSPEEAVGKILSGDVDVAAVPSNLGAVLNNKTKGGITMLAVNTGGVLYLLENGSDVKSINDLKGKTILASGKGGAPEYILDRLLSDAGLDPAKDVTIQWMANHADVSSTMMTQKGSVALLPEPFVTVTESKSADITTALDLNKLWKDKYNQELPMGALIARADFVKDRGDDLKIFLKDYEDSVKKVNKDPAAAAKIVSEKGIISDEKTAEAAIPKCNIIFLPGDQAKAALQPFYDVLFKMDPASLGGAMPGDDFYYSGK